MSCVWLVHPFVSSHKCAPKGNTILIDPCPHHLTQNSVLSYHLLFQDSTWEFLGSIFYGESFSSRLEEHVMGLLLKLLMNLLVPSWGFFSWFCMFSKYENHSTHIRVSTCFTESVKHASIALTVPLDLCHTPLASKCPHYGNGSCYSNSGNCVPRNISFLPQPPGCYLPLFYKWGSWRTEKLPTCLRSIS